MIHMIRMSNGNKVYTSMYDTYDTNVKWQQRVYTHELIFQRQPRNSTTSTCTTLIISHVKKGWLNEFHFLLWLWYFYVKRFLWHGPNTFWHVWVLLYMIPQCHVKIMHRRVAVNWVHHWWPFVLAKMWQHIIVHDLQRDLNCFFTKRVF